MPHVDVLQAHLLQLRVPLPLLGLELVVPVSFNLPVQYFELNTEETANILGILPTICNLLKQETNKTIPEESKKLISQTIVINLACG